MQVETIQLEPVADFRRILGKSELVAFNVGPNLGHYAVGALKELDYHTESGGATFPKSKPTVPQSYRVVVLHEGEISLDIQIVDEPFNIHDIQPLPKSELLLVCSRSRYNGHDGIEHNGRVYSQDGRPLRQILLGDGIENIQTTAGGTIWTSYFDEGVFGNFGWKHPVGSSGLIAWNADGTKQYEFTPEDGLDYICDCYAMNVESDSSTWLYYYTEFPLVHLRNRTLSSHWKMPLAGSHAFAVAGGFALFGGGYDDRHTYHLFELPNKSAPVELRQFKLIDERSNQIAADAVFGRGDALFIQRMRKVYRLDIAMAIDH